MTDLIPAGLPPWLAPLLIVSIAMAFVLLLPALRSFSKAGAGAAQAFWLLVPVIGLVIVAVLMMVRVMPVAGKPRLLALLVIVPLVNVMFLWLFAFGAWSEGAASGIDRRTARRREAKTGEAQRETPTLSGHPDTAVASAATGSADGGGRPAGMIEPTLQADAGLSFGAGDASSTPAGGPTLTSAAGAGAIGDAKGAAGDRPAAADSDRAAEMAENAGDRTIVAGAISKGRTKVAARTDDELAARKEAKTRRPGAADLDQYDLIGASDQDGFDQDGFNQDAAGLDAAGQDVQADDVYDEDGEPIDRAASMDDGVEDRADDDGLVGDGLAGDRGAEEGLSGKDLKGESAAVDQSARGAGAASADHGGAPAAAAETISEEDLTLAEGVLNDLQQGAMDPTESPVLTALPLTDDAPSRVWLVQGVNARAANIEASIREEDISRSVTGILVGRSNRADFIIDDESVSRNHARFVYVNGTLHVEDLDSMNGTWVDGEKLSANDQQPLRRASDVEFGKIRLEVKEVDPT